MLKLIVAATLVVAVLSPIEAYAKVKSDPKTNTASVGCESDNAGGEVCCLKVRNKGGEVVSEFCRFSDGQWVKVQN